MTLERELSRARAQAERKRHELFSIVSGSIPLSGRDTPGGLVEKASEVVRNHPIGSTGAGLALGFAIASMHEPLRKEIEKSLKEVATRVTNEASTMAHEAFSNSISGIATELMRQFLTRV